MNFKKISYIHIPKTGGQTVESIVKPIIGNDFYNSCQFGNIRETTQRKTYFIFGHNPYDLYGYDEPDLNITMLRNPVDRIVSFYYHYTRHGNDIIKPGYSLDEFIRLDVKHLDNGMVRQLANMDFSENRIDKEVCSSDYLKAKNNLDNCLFGIMEKFDEFMAELFEVVGIGTVPKYGIIAKGNYNYPTSDVIDCISGRNEFDRMLYDYACEVKYGIAP